MIKVHNPNNLPTISVKDLISTQGDLKDLDETNYNKLKNNIIHRGFIDPLAIWQSKDGKKYILNGHQRQRVLIKEGWVEPVPYFNIPAKNLKEAAQIVLELTSQYGKITQDGFDEFMAKYELDEAEIYGSTNFDALVNYESEAEEVEDSRPYTDRIQVPVYKIKDEQPELKELVNKDKMQELLDNIDNSNVPEDVKTFLRLASCRHAVFNYQKIAEFYAAADQETQELMESSALVIIDLDKAIEEGFVEVTETINNIHKKDVKDTK